MSLSIENSANYSLPNDWKLKDGRTIRLITPTELKFLHDGEVLYSIDGDVHILGKDPIDDDTRFGYLAYGIMLHE